MQIAYHPSVLKRVASVIITIDRLLLSSTIILIITILLLDKTTITNAYLRLLTIHSIETVTVIAFCNEQKIVVISLLSFIHPIHLRSEVDRRAHHCPRACFR